jgi:hypothetical protein
MNVGSVGSNFTYVFARARRVSPAFVPFARRPSTRAHRRRPPIAPSRAPSSRSSRARTFFVGAYANSSLSAPTNVPTARRASIARPVGRRASTPATARDARAIARSIVVARRARARVCGATL